MRSSHLVGVVLGLLIIGCSGADSTSGPPANGSGGATNVGSSTPGVGGTATSGGAGATTGGVRAAGGVTGIGGNSAIGGSNTLGGSTGTGGNIPAGGSRSIGGAAPMGGALSTGGIPATGGAAPTGGSKAAGGTTATGGKAATGGSTSAGGAVATGGLATTGGSKATGGMPATGGTSANGGTGACSHAQMKGSDFCTIGDSWIAMPGNQVTTLENHLVAAGVIPSGEHFDRREVSGTTLSTIIGTYSNKPANCKILIMDGGGIDLFSTPLGPEAKAVTDVVTAFKNFLAKVKSDGYVQHVIYSLYPVIPSTANLNANMKPGFSAACATSAVDCHLVDLEPLFQGQHFASDRTHADTAGGVIIGDAWWKAMQENCVAQ